MTFPPGRARLATKPCSTGLALVAITIGMVPVASRGPGRGAPVRDQDVDRQADQLGREGGQPVELALEVAPLDTMFCPST